VTNREITRSRAKRTILLFMIFSFKNHLAIIR